MAHYKGENWEYRIISVNTPPEINEQIGEWSELCKQGFKNYKIIDAGNHFVLIFRKRKITI